MSKVLERPNRFGFYWFRKGTTREGSTKITWQPWTMVHVFGYAPFFTVEMWRDKPPYSNSDITAYQHDRSVQEWIRVGHPEED